MKLNYLDFEFIVGESAVQKPQRQLAYFTDGGLDRFFGFEILGKREFWGYCTFHQFIKNNNISANYLPLLWDFLGRHSEVGIFGG